MVTKIELKLALADTTLEYLTSHVVTLGGEVHHYVFKDGMTTPCGLGIIGARPVPVAEARGRLCARCGRIVKALEK